MDAQVHRGTVLVVEDIDAVGAVFARALGSAGFEVVRANNGSDALTRLTNRRFDAVLSDIGMPTLDGIGLLHAVRERDLDVPVVLVTGNPTMETALEAVEHGALRYLTKPVLPKDLVRTMARAVHLGRLARVKREAINLVGEVPMRFGDRAGLEVGFERALSRLWMAYQPIVRWSERSVFAFEALIRSEDEMLPHAEAVLGAADRLGALSSLGRTVRNQVGATVSASDIPLVFVNLHPTDLLDEDLFSPEALLCQLAPKVVLEITERASLTSIGDLSKRVDSLRDLGFRIAIDDVGAGYAGLSSVAQLEPDVMKIDMALVRDVDREPVKQKLVEAITRLSREMDMLVVAEGVETVAERDTLARLGCDLMQGYLFAKPDRPFPEARFGDAGSGE